MTFSTGLANALPWLAIFNRLHDTVFFVKDASGRYIAANDTLVSRCSLGRPEQLVGKRPSDVLGATLGQGYESQDQSVLATGTQIIDRLELHTYANRQIGWCLTSKFPLTNAAGEIIGIAGISKDLQSHALRSNDFAQLNAMISLVETRLSAPPRLDEICATTGLSVYQLDRRIRRMFGLTIGQWILKQRLELAQRLLRDPSQSIAGIGLDCGYQDQSAFTRQFRKTTGLTPSQYRAVHDE
tara:strand:- start:808 stop:1530 length:723 start_codon:yes stop_codon:yes gene_type:complete